jgi:hypothetical protein
MYCLCTLLLHRIKGKRILKAKLHKPCLIFREKYIFIKTNNAVLTILTGGGGGVKTVLKKSALMHPNRLKSRFPPRNITISYILNYFLSVVKWNKKSKTGR